MNSNFREPSIELKEYLSEKILNYLDKKLSSSKKYAKVLKISIVLITIVFLFRIVAFSFGDATVLVCILIGLIWVNSLYKRNIKDFLEEINTIKSGRYLIQESVSTDYSKAGNTPGYEDIFIKVDDREVRFMFPTNLEKRVEYGEVLKFIVIQYDTTRGKKLLAYSYDLEEVYPRYIE